MKKIFLAFCVAVAALSVKAQAPYACVDKGAVLEYAVYNEEDKLDHYQRQVIQEASSLGDGNYDLRIQHSEIEKPGQKAEGDDVSVILSEIRNNRANVSFMGTDGAISVTGSDAALTSLPNKLAVGYQLPIGDMSANIEGLALLVTVTENEVIGRDEVKVPAGSFKCYIVKQTIQLNMMGAAVATTTKTWYSRGVGIVKSETTMGSRLVGRQELVTFKK